MYTHVSEKAPKPFTGRQKQRILMKSNGILQQNIWAIYYKSLTWFKEILVGFPY